MTTSDSRSSRTGAQERQRGRGRGRRERDQQQRRNEGPDNIYEAKNLTKYFSKAMLCLVIFVFIQQQRESPAIRQQVPSVRNNSASDIAIAIATQEPSQMLSSIASSGSAPIREGNNEAVGPAEHTTQAIPPGPPETPPPQQQQQQQQVDASAATSPLPNGWAKYTASYQYLPPSTNSTTDWKPAPECGVGPDYKDFFSLPFKLRSRLGEDEIIYQHFFKNKTQQQLSSEDHGNETIRGTYVELGAFNGAEEANSRFFDLCLGWKGLLIEGMPTTFEKMKNARPSASRMSFAPSCSAEYEAVNKTVQFANYPMANSGLKGKALTYDAKPHVDVPCGPLGPVLQDVFEGGHINFFSLDVEGAEPDVLENIDFSKVKIDVLMIEVENNFCERECESRDRTRSIMDRAGYIRYEKLVHKSDVYVLPGSDFVLPDWPHFKLPSTRT